MRAVSRWVLHRAKHPVSAHTGRAAAWADPATWSTFDAAVAATAVYPVDGIGFVFGDGWAGIDLDHCRDAASGEVARWAADIVAAARSYTEVSPSGTGLHVICLGALPDGADNRLNRDDGGAVEMYDHGRFFTVTGDRLNDYGVADLNGRLARLHADVFGPTAERAPFERAAGPIHEGQGRNDYLTSYAGRMRASGHTVEETRALVMLENDRVCVPPLSVREVDATIMASAARWERGPRPPVHSPDSRPLGQGQTAPSGRRLVVVTMSDVEPAEVDWLWRSRIPLGKITMFDGDPGLGKSMVALDIAARVTRGRVMPDRTPGIPVADCVVLTTEDDEDDTIRPRLDAAMADVSRVHVIPGMDGGRTVFTLPADVDLLEELVVKTGAMLVVVDGLMAFLGGAKGADSNSDAGIREALTPVRFMAKRTNCAVVVIRHLNKQTGGNAISRGAGSMGIIGVARAGLLVGEDPEQEGLMVLAAHKHNLAAASPSLAYRVVGGETGPPHVVWAGVSPRTANDLVAEHRRGRATPALDEAIAFLRAELAGGPIESLVLRKRADDVDITYDTLKRAKAELSVRSVRLGGDVGPISWALPE